jgi:hypothetical protein
MSLQKVVAIQDIKKGEKILVYSGLVRVVLGGIHKPSGEALSDIARGEVALFNPEAMTLKKDIFR